MKLILTIALAVTAWLGAADCAFAQARRDVLETLRADMRADRKAVVAAEMNLTETESEAFWPLYRAYRTEVDQIGDELVKLVLEYGDSYPNVPEEKARELLKRYNKAEADLVKVKARHLKKFEKVLPPSKVFRFAQIDHRLDLGTRVALAGSIPLMPVGKTSSHPQ